MSSESGVVHDPQQVVRALHLEYVRKYPQEAARAIAQMKKSEIAELLLTLPAQDAVSVWERLDHSVADMVFSSLPQALQVKLVANSDPTAMARLLARFSRKKRTDFLALLTSAKAHELEALVSYPDDSAAGMMEVRFVALHAGMTVRQALLLIKRYKPRFSSNLFLLDAEGRLENMVSIQDLALSEAATLLADISKPVPAAVLATASPEEVLEKLDIHKQTDLPVVDMLGKLIGVIRYDALMETVREESTADMMTMVGASRDERALSNIGFVVRKRLPWLQINLLTAFLAASVVGIFESTIAQFTALAVLLPVVAGQSGNTGAQALAVTMRGLALREFGTSQWQRVARKELGAALVNGVAIALTTAIGVLLWSGSPGLALIITIAMVISMSAAGLAGVLIPIILSSMGQDPAQSSSIILTTVTDVVGFFSFLGIATLLVSMI